MISGRASIFLALRYLRPKRSFVSVITLLSIIGPVLGVAVLIVVISVMAGFDREIKQRILGMQAHIQLRPIFGPAIEDPQPILERLEAAGYRAAPIVEGPVLIHTRSQLLPKLIKGIDPARERFVTDLHSGIIQGDFEIDNDEVLIGREMALQLQLQAGDKFLIHSPEQLNKMVTFGPDGSITAQQPDEVYTAEEVVVKGIFALDMFEFDSQIVVMHIDKADELFGLDWGAANAIQVKTDNPFNLTAPMQLLREDDLFHSLAAMTWQEANRRLFDALTVEKRLMFFVLVFIVVVAAFGIANTLITVAIQKTREIGILSAMGAAPSVVLLVFVLQGAIVGALGNLAGTLLGLLVVRYRDRIADLFAMLFGVEIFPSDLYHLAEIPARIDAGDLIVINLIAFALCVLAALIPACYAAALTPARALREDT